MCSSIVECIDGIRNQIALCHKLQTSDLSQIAGLITLAATLYPWTRAKG